VDKKTRERDAEVEALCQLMGHSAQGLSSRGGISLANRKTVDNGDNSKKKANPKTAEKLEENKQIKDGEEKPNKYTSPIDYNPPMHEQQQPPVDHVEQLPPWEDQPWRWRPPGPYQRPYGGGGGGGYRPHYNNYLWRLIATMEAEEHITDSTEEEEDMVDTVGELLKFNLGLIKACLRNLESCLCGCCLALVL
jgi:hypothetical protein